METITESVASSGEGEAETKQRQAAVICMPYHIRH